MDEKGLKRKLSEMTAADVAVDHFDSPFDSTAARFSFDSVVT